MIVRRFLAWSRLVAPGQRADGVRALAQGYLYSSMPDEMRREAEAALTSMLDDPSPLVRLALAEAFASAREAPRHCVIALACDQPEIAALVLGRSPLLLDEDLIDCAARGEPAIQSAIASRPSLSAAVSAALVEFGAVEALTALAQNAGADVPELSLRRMVERFGADGALREALLSRPDLAPSVRTDLVHAAAAALSAFVSERGWLSAERAERLSRDAFERASIAIAFEAAQEDPQDGCVDMARRLRIAGRLSPALMLRALLSDHRSLFEAALAELSGLPLARAAGFVRYHQGGGFAALYACARMPADLLPVFQSALAAQDQAGETRPRTQARLSRRLIGLVLGDCAGLEGAGMAKVTALLRRFDAEAAQQDARDLMEQLSEAHPDSAVAPELLGAARAPMLAFADLS